MSNLNVKLKDEAFNVLFHYDVNFNEDEVVADIMLANMNGCDHTVDLFDDDYINLSYRDLEEV